VRLSAWPLLPSQEEQNARKPIQFKREQALILGFSSQPWNRFVHLDLPGLIRSWEIAEME